MGLERKDLTHISLDNNFPVANSRPKTAQLCGLHSLAKTARWLRGDKASSNTTIASVNQWTSYLTYGRTFQIVIDYSDADE